MSDLDAARVRARSGVVRSWWGFVFPGRPSQALIAALGGFIAIFVLAWLGSLSKTVMLIAPFGASCVLVFGVPQSPLAQPRNVIGGHCVATLIGLLVLMLVGATPFGCALGVGLAIALMLLTDTTHPPAGADPLVVLMLAAPWSFLLVPVLSGAVVIVLIGVIYHNTVSKKVYPIK